MAKAAGKSSFSPTLFSQRGYLHPKAICSTIAPDVFCCELNRNGDMIGASLSDGSVMVFETTNGSVVYKLPLPSHQDKLPATAIRFRSVETDLQNIALVAYSSGHVHQWHISTGKSLSCAIEKRQTLAAAYSLDATTYATSGSDCKLLVYDSSTNDCINVLQASSSYQVMDGHMNRVFALRYHPNDPHLLLSGGWDDTVQFWDIRQNESVRKLSGPHICGDALDIEPNTVNIATGSWRYETPLQVWDYGSGNLITSLSSCTSTKLYALCWLSERYLLIGGSQKHCASVVDFQNDRVVGDLKDVSAGVYSVHYNRQIKMAAISSGTKIYLCPSPLPSPLLPIRAPSTFITELDK